MKQVEVSPPILVYERPQFTEMMYQKACDSPLPRPSRRESLLGKLHRKMSSSFSLQSGSELGAESQIPKRRWSLLFARLFPGRRHEQKEPAPPSSLVVSFQREQ
ncbi:hypothetical protein BASA81_010587 [Batrachochytrium salamandrivorans]|nr:hypothetical protein BASA81_010587 [Batrachochytrium salamandrivorans]